MKKQRLWMLEFLFASSGIKMWFADHEGFFHLTDTPDMATKFASEEIARDYLEDVIVGPFKKKLYIVEFDTYAHETH